MTSHTDELQQVSNHIKLEIFLREKQVLALLRSTAPIDRRLQGEKIC